MRDTKSFSGWLLQGTAAAIASLFAVGAEAAAPGITGNSLAGHVRFDLRAEAAYISQPDGTSVYSWGYGCNSAPAGFKPSAIDGAACPTMQLPGPTLIVTEGDTVTIRLSNKLPKAAGNTSILFPGFNVCAATLNPDGSCTGVPSGAAGVLTQEAANGGTVTYTFVANKAGTHSYYSGTQGDLQVEMGLYGALIVLPSTVPDVCNNTPNDAAQGRSRAWPTGAQADFRLANAAYNHPSACYDREYLFQFSEMDLAIHQQTEEQVRADAAKPGQQCANATGCLAVATEPYVPTYFMINGRSMPDLMEPNYSLSFPNQPYNGNPHMHPGELTLLRIIGTGRWQHPFHEHGNHVRVLARDGNLITTRDQQARGPAAVHDNHDARHGDGRHLRVDRQGTELGRLRTRTAHAWVAGLARHRPVHSGCERLLHLGADGGQLLRVVRRPFEAAGRETVRCRRQGRPRYAARSEHLRLRSVVRRQSISRPRRHCACGRSHADPAVRARSATRVTKPASSSCGTRITSARSRPTTPSRAAC